MIHGHKRWQSSKSQFWKSPTSKIFALICIWFLDSWWCSKFTNTFGISYILYGVAKVILFILLKVGFFIKRSTYSGRFNHNVFKWKNRNIGVFSNKFVDRTCWFIFSTPLEFDISLSYLLVPQIMRQKNWFLAAWRIAQQTKNAKFSIYLR